MRNDLAFHLVKPADQKKPNANIEAIASYLAWLIFQVAPKRELFSNEILAFKHENLVEIWYWYDSLNLTHRIVFWGENLPFADVIKTEKYEPYIEHAYYWFPLVMYHAFCDTALFIAAPPPEERARRLGLKLTSRNRKWIESLKRGENLILRGDERYWREPLRHLIPYQRPDNSTVEISDKILGDISDSTISFGMADRSPEARISLGDGTSWDAVIAFTERCNKKNVVSVAEAARLIIVEPKTIYSYCKGTHPRLTEAQREALGVNNTLDCYPCRSGYTHVTRDSLKRLVTILHGSAEFDAWTLAEDKLKQKQAAEIEKNNKPQK